MASSKPHPQTSLSFLLQFPVGRRSACDIYWHGVSFHDNDNIISGQVNKFPGTLIPSIYGKNLWEMPDTILYVVTVFPIDDFPASQFNIQCLFN